MQHDKMWMKSGEAGERKRENIVQKLLCESGHAYNMQRKRNHVENVI